MVCNVPNMEFMITALEKSRQSPRHLPSLKNVMENYLILQYSFLFSYSSSFIHLLAKSILAIVRGNIFTAAENHFLHKQTKMKVPQRNSAERELNKSLLITFIFYVQSSFYLFFFFLPFNNSYCIQPNLKILKKSQNISKK